MLRREPAAVRTHALHVSDVQIIERVIGEYQEMPGLALTLPQAMRLWGCDEATCRRVVAVLVETRVLRFLRDGRLVRAD